MLRRISKWIKTAKTNSTVFEQKRVLIFGLGRTGSTLLEDLLQSTGHFKAHGELFNPSQPIQENPLQYFIGQANLCYDKHFISHVKIYEMASVELAGISKRDFLDGLIENGWQIIYLTRTNKLRHNLSSYRAQESSIFHTEITLPKRLKIIDCFVFKHGVKWLISQEVEERELLQNINCIEIQYERHLENELSHQPTINFILEKLKLPHRDAHTKHKKVVKGSLKSLIENYAEFEEVMIESGFEKYLDSAESLTS